MNIFKLVGSIFVDTEQANESISKTDKKAGSLGTTLVNGAKTAGKFAVGLGTACAAGATALFGVATSAASTTDNIDKMSQKIGISRQAYQELDFICSQSGASVDNLKAGMKTLTNQMQMASEGSDTATAAFDALGLSWTDGTGKLKDQETMMWEAFSALQSCEDQTQKAALATDLFGKAGTELMPMLNGAEGSIESMKQQAHDLGLVMGDEAVDAGVKLTDTIDQTKRAFSAIVSKIGVSVMPIIQKLLEWVISKMPVIQKVLGVAFDFIKKMITTVVNVIDRLKTRFEKYMPKIKEFTTKAFSGMVNFWNNHLKPCFAAINNFIRNVLAPAFKFVFQNVIKPVVQTVFAGIGNLWKTTLKPVFTNIIDFIKNVFSGNFSGAFKNIVNVVSGIWKGLVNVVKTPINSVIGVINRFIGGLNKLKIPDWVPGVGGKGINISKIPLLAKGGNILESGHAIVGEAGAELIELPAGARVSPLTNGQGDVLGTDKLLPILNAILNELKQLNKEMYEKMLYALINGIKIDWNDRELARLVRKYA